MMMVSPCPQKDFSPPKEKMIKASIDFNGDHRGIISLVVPDSWTEELAHYILGIKENHEIPPGSGHSSLSELINIVCGEFLRESFDSQDQIEMGLPQLDIIKEDDFFDYEADKNVKELIANEEKIYCRVEMFN